MANDQPSKNYLRYQRERRKLTRDRLAELVGTSTSQITKLERGERKLSQEWIERLSQVLDVPPVSLISAWTIQVTGIVGEDGAVIYSEKGGIPDVEEIEAPAQATSKTMALQVKGDTLPGFAENGAFVVFEWDAVSIPRDIYGRMGVVWCRDGRIIVRRIAPGSADYKCTLISSTGRAEYDVEIKQIIRISWVRMP